MGNKFIEEILQEMEGNASAQHWKALQTVEELRELLKTNSYCQYAVSTYGSIDIPQLFIKNSDIDLSIKEWPIEGADDLSSPKECDRDTVVKHLQLFRIGLGLNSIKAYQIISHARVPIIKFNWWSTDLQCDVSYNNQHAMLRTQFLKLICDCSPKISKALKLIKMWASCQNINNAKEGYPNPFCYLVLGIFTLQDLGIVPILSPIFESMNLDRAISMESLNLISDQLQQAIKPKEETMDIFQILSHFFTLHTNYMKPPKGTNQSLEIDIWNGKAQHSYSSRSGTLQLKILDPFEGSNMTPQKYNNQRQYITVYSKFKEGSKTLKDPNITKWQLDALFVSGTRPILVPRPQMSQMSQMSHGFIGYMQPYPQSVGQADQSRVPYYTRI